MGKERQKETVLQWHPAFFAGLQIELAGEAENLIFENEHQLGTKPKAIDVLVIKKNTEDVVSKNLGRIFKKHNIVEYKGPDDYLSVDDFYKVYGYACFYKADTALEDQIPITDITITLVCRKYPKKLAAHLLRIRNYRLCPYENGIYYIVGDVLPIQVIVTSELSEEKNLWLKSLGKDIGERATAEKLIAAYGLQKGNGIYESAMEMIVRANREIFEEVDGMCEALEEVLEIVMKDKLDARERQGMEQGMEQGILQGIRAMILDNLEEGVLQERICEKLQRRFSLTEEKALEYIASVTQ